MIATDTALANALGDDREAQSQAGPVLRSDESATVTRVANLEAERS